MKEHRWHRGDLCRRRVGAIRRRRPGGCWEIDSTDVCQSDHYPCALPPASIHEVSEPTRWRDGILDKPATNCRRSVEVIKRVANWRTTACMMASTLPSDVNWKVTVARRSFREWPMWDCIHLLYGMSWLLRPRLKQDRIYLLEHCNSHNRSAGAVFNHSHVSYACRADGTKFTPWKDAEIKMVLGEMMPSLTTVGYRWKAEVFHSLKFCGTVRTLWCCQNRVPVFGKQYSAYICSNIRVAFKV
jgi:hypothetical protein